MTSFRVGKRLVAIGLIFFPFLISGPLHSQTVDESGFVKLERLFSEKKLEIDVAASKKKTALLERYGKALENNQKAFQKEGDLKSVMIAKAEIEAAAAGDLTDQVKGTKLPEAIQKIRTVADTEFESILQSRNSELADLRSKYVKALESLKVAETKAGHLESAIAIAKEIERIQELAKASEVMRDRSTDDIPEPLREGLIAWFSLDKEEDMVVTGSSSKKLKGALEGTTYLKQGKMGGARTFNGTSDRIKLGSQIPDSEEVTIALWVRSKNTPGSGGLFSDYTGANANDLMLALVGANRLVIRADKNKKRLKSYVEFSAPLTEKWHHIAWVMDSASSTVYLDGKKVDRIREEGSNTGSHGAFIGFAHDGNAWSYFHGDIDEFMMWERPLGAREIESIYQLFQ